MHLAIFGATGRTGKHLVRQALGAGHTVTALVRTPSRLAEVGLDVEHDRLHVVHGDAMNAADVEAAVRDAEAVLLALGHAKGTPDAVLEVATRHVLKAMEQYGVRRLVNETGAGVGDERDAPPSLGARIMTAMLKLLAGRLLADSERQAALIRASDADWTIVRAPRLTEGEHTGDYRVGYMDLGLGAQIARADVADFMLRLAVEGGYVHEAPKITA